MSFVLDALRKSEHERQRQHGPGIAELPVARPATRPPWAMIAIAVLVTLNLAVLALVLRRQPPAPPPAVAALPATGLPPPAPATAAAPTVPATAAAPTAPAPATAFAPAAPSALPPVRPLLDAAPPPPATAVAPPPAPDPTLLPAGPGAAAFPPAVTQADGTASAAPIAGLPADLAAGLPELGMDLHVYTDEPARRVVFINGRRYQSGGVLAEGPTLVEITRDGAVLEYRGRRFLLPRQ